MLLVVKTLGLDDCRRRLMTTLLLMLSLVVLVRLIPGATLILMMIAFVGTAALLVRVMLAIELLLLMTRATRMLNCTLMLRCARRLVNNRVILGFRMCSSGNLFTLRIAMFRLVSWVVVVALKLTYLVLTTVIGVLFRNVV